MDIGNRLKQIRINKGLSGEALEILSGVSQSTISRIELNKTSPSIATLEQLCNAMQISIKDLLNDEELSPEIIRLIAISKKLNRKDQILFNELIKKFNEFIEQFDSSK